MTLVYVEEYPGAENLVRSRVGRCKIVPLSVMRGVKVRNAEKGSPREGRKEEGRTRRVGKARTQIHRKTF